jgi:hypothetical protein
VQEQRESRQRRLRAIISGLPSLPTAPDAERQELRVQVAQHHRQVWQLCQAALPASAGEHVMVRARYLLTPLAQVLGCKGCVCPRGQEFGATPDTCVDMCPVNTRRSTPGGPCEPYLCDRGGVCVDNVRCAPLTCRTELGHHLWRQVPLPRPVRREQQWRMCRTG